MGSGANRKQRTGSGDAFPICFPPLLLSSSPPLLLSSPELTLRARDFVGRTSRSGSASKLALPALSASTAGSLSEPDRGGGSGLRVVAFDSTLLRNGVKTSGRSERSSRKGRSAFS